MVPLDDTLHDLPDPRDVVLPLRLRLERAELAGDEGPLEGPVRHLDGAAVAEDVGFVESFAGRVVLLPVAVTRPRIGGHDDSGLGAVDSGPPGVARLGEPSVLPLERVLTHVPDVALLVLGVEVEGPLDRPAALGHRIPDDRALDAQNLFRLSGHDLIVDLRSLSARALEVESRARLQGPVTVVDRDDEVRRVDRGGVGSVNRRQVGRRSQCCGGPGLALCAPRAAAASEDGDEQGDGDCQARRCRQERLESAGHVVWVLTSADEMRMRVKTRSPMFARFGARIRRTKDEWRRLAMKIDRELVLDELRKQGQSDKVQKALDELPAKVDHEQHAALLEKFGIDPGQLAEKAAKKGLASL